MGEHDFAARAADPTQYDSPELRWNQEGFIDSPVRVFFWERLKPLLGNLAGKSVLDVGTGTAWLPFRMQQELDATDTTALEPSATQQQLAHQFNPNQAVEPVSLDDYETDRTFDVITAIMMFEHVLDLDAAFAKLADLTQPGSQFLTIMADKHTFLRPRQDYQVEQQDIDEDTVAIRATRTYGVLYDIVRPVDQLVRAAAEHGFDIRWAESLVPDGRLRSQVTRYNDWPGQPICHLLDFDRE